MDNLKKWNSKGFVESMIARVKDDTTCRAGLRRADNPDTASYAWEYLVPFCDITADRERLAFALIGAAIAREQPDGDGDRNIGQALGVCGQNGDDRDRELRRLRRLLTCDSTEELCGILRPVIRYLQAKEQRIGYAALLQDILYWNERTKLRWTRDFFGRTAADGGGDDTVKESANVSD